MDSTHAGIIAAQWRQLDAIDLHASLVDSTEAAAIMGIDRSHFLRLAREDDHPLVEFLRPAIFILQPSGMRTGQQFWRHRIGVAAYVYRNLANHIGGPIGIDVRPADLAQGRAYGPEVVAGAMAAIEAAERRTAANGTDEGEPPEDA